MVADRCSRTNRGRWTDADKRLTLTLFAARVAYKVIARRVGRTLKAVCEWLARRGRRRKCTLSPQRAASAYRRHGSVRAAADALGVRYSVCRGALARAGVPVRRSGFGWTGRQRAASAAAGWPPVVESERAILAALHADPLQTGAELAGLLGRNVAGTHARLRMMVVAGYVVRVPSRLGPLYDLTQGVRSRRTQAIRRQTAVAA